MSEPFLCTIVGFGGNFAPRGWMFCNGQLLPINQYQAVFSLLGTNFGGNGTTTFGLPDLRGRVPIHVGGQSSNAGPGLSTYAIGQLGGVEGVALTAAQLPAHTHSQPATSGVETTNRPNNAIPARGGIYATTPDGSLLAATTSVGGNQAHPNIQPFLALNYIIALEGIFPSRN